MVHVIRAISVLEGIALVGNPEFAIIDEAYPYIARRLMTDNSPRLRAACLPMPWMPQRPASAKSTQQPHCQTAPSQKRTGIRCDAGRRKYKMSTQDSAPTGIYDGQEWRICLFGKTQQCGCDWIPTRRLGLLDGKDGWHDDASHQGGPLQAVRTAKPWQPQ